MTMASVFRRGLLLLAAGALAAGAQGRGGGGRSAGPSEPKASRLPQEVQGQEWLFHIPEFHDSQRLYDATGRYGSFKRIFSLPNAIGLTTVDYEYAWQLVALVLVDTWTPVIDADYAVGGLDGSATLPAT